MTWNQQKSSHFTITKPGWCFSHTYTHTFFSTQYTSLGANLPLISFSEMAPWCNKSLERVMLPSMPHPILFFWIKYVWTKILLIVINSIMVSLHNCLWSTMLITCVHLDCKMFSKFVYSYWKRSCKLSEMTRGINLLDALQTDIFFNQGIS